MMKNALAILMSLALICGLSYADLGTKTQAVDRTGSTDNPVIYANDRGTDRSGSLDKFEHDPDDDTSSERCTPCDDLVLCGTPAEDGANNNACADPDPTELGCGSVIYGKACETSDYFVVSVPGWTELVITIFDGEDCSRNPTQNARMKPYYRDSCQPMLNYYSHNQLTARNESSVEWSFVLRVRRDQGENTTYMLTTACSQIPNPCPDGIRNYCFDPIIVPAGVFENNVYRYEHTESTCCATREVLDVWESDDTGACGVGTDYDSGPDAIYMIVLEDNAIFQLVEVGVIGGGDVQFMIFTDCSDPEGSCVYSQDDEISQPEHLEDIELPGPETYYLSTSRYNDHCDIIYVIIESDIPLPVELNEFSAIPGDREVALTWTTASEANTDYFDILRDGMIVGRREATNSPVGASYSYTDVRLTNGVEYTYTLVEVGFDGKRVELATISATPTFTSATVTNFTLHQNYPNPFNPETSIAFDLIESGAVSLKIYNPVGRLVRTLVNEAMNEGRHVVTFDGRGLPSGLYLYRLEVNGFVAQKKMLLIK